MPNPTRRGPATTFANCNGRTLIRKTSFASRSIRRRQRSSFADLTCGHPRPMDEGLGRTHVCRSAQNGLGDREPLQVRNHCAVRPERSPLHDVRQHAAADASCKARCSCEFHFLRTSNLKRCRTGSPLVEPDGIEPTTSCLQSRRSPS
jgi:hypothetical protein